MTVQPTKSGETSGGEWTVRRVIEWTTGHLARHGSDTPRLDAEILLAHARGCQRIDLYTRFDDALSNTEREVMRGLVRRRAEAEPVAYLVGHREFYAIDFRVTRDVLIPRPETETLVMELLELAKGDTGPRILDVGTGSGCIAVAAAVNAPMARITATDVSRPALDVARENAAAHDVADRIEFRQGDLFEPIGPDEQFDFIVSNPPYVAEAEMETLQADVRLHEPRSALVAGPDGLDVMRRLIAAAPNHLAARGHLLVEIAPEQAAAVCELLASQGEFTESDVIKDLADGKRVVRARRTG